MTANNGVTLTSGSSVTLKVDNLADIYVNSPIARGSVGYVAEVR